MSDDSIFTVRDLITALVALVAEGRLTADHIWEAWHRDRALRNYTRNPPWHEGPRDLHDDLAHNMGGSMVAGMVRKWKPTYGIRLPLVVEWILDPQDAIRENRTAFEALDMDRAAFVRELLEDKFFGARMRYEVATNPYLLGFLPEEERWQRLEAVVREFGTAIGWDWPYYTARHWSEERTITLVHRLVTEPELAGGFLAGERAHIGWLIFWNLGDFFDILKTAMLHAPYEASMNRAWIATAIGDRMVNERSFMKMEFEDDDPGNDPYYYWWGDPRRVHEDFGSKGEARATALINEALSVLWDMRRTPEDELKASFSGPSRALAWRFYLLTVEIKPSVAKQVAEILLDLPDCDFSRSLLDLIIDRCKLEELSHVYRWLLCPGHRWSLVRYYVLGKTKGESLFAKLERGEECVRASWFEPVVRQAMEAKGWQFKIIEFRRNERFDEKSPRGYDPQVKLVSGRVTSIYSIWHGHSHGWHDFYPDRPLPEGWRPKEVMIPPNFDPGQAVHSNPARGFFVYRVGDNLLLAQPWDYEYLRRCRFGSL